MSPYGQINVHDVCFLWVKSLRIASCNLIPSVESTGNDTTLWYEIEVICYVYILFPLLKEQVQFIFFFFLHLFVSVEETISPTDPAALNWGCLHGETILRFQGLNASVIQILSQTFFLLLRVLTCLHFTFFQVHFFICDNSITYWP